MIEQKILNTKVKPKKIKYIFLFFAAALLFSINSAYAGSVLSLPLPDDIPVYTDNEQYNRYMTLEIKMPESFKDPKPVKEKKEQRKRDFSYFDFNPYKRVEDDPELHRAIKSLLKKGLGKGEFKSNARRSLYNNGRLNSTYTMGTLVRTILVNFMRLTDEQILRDVKFTREDLEDMKYIMKTFKKELFLLGYMNLEKVYNRIEESRKILKFNQGVVRVVKVENDMKGGTVLHFVVRENQFPQGE
jgi:hypothetical protein